MRYFKTIDQILINSSNEMLHFGHQRELEDLVVCQAMLRSGCSSTNAHTGATFILARWEINACLEQMHATKKKERERETMPQQLSQGCARHTNEGIDRIPSLGTVVFSNLNWCTNLQLE